MAEKYSPVMNVSQRTIVSTTWKISRNELENLIRSSVDFPEKAVISFDIECDDWNNMTLQGVEITHVSETNDYGL